MDKVYPRRDFRQPNAGVYGVATLALTSMTRCFSDTPLHAPDIASMDPMVRHRMRLSGQLLNDGMRLSRRRRGNSNLVWVEAGKVIDGVLVTGRQEDARNLQALLSVAQIRIASGDTSATTVFRDGNNVDHKLTPPQIVNLFLQSSAYVTEVYAASWALIAFDPIRPIWPRTAIGPANSLIVDNFLTIRSCVRPDAGGSFGR